MKAIEELELFAWVGEDEHGSGEIGLKQGFAPAGYVPMVAVHRDKVEKFAIQFEGQAARFGKRIHLVRFQAIEIVRSTRNGQ